MCNQADSPKRRNAARSWGAKRFAGAVVLLVVRYERIGVWEASGGEAKNRLQKMVTVYGLLVDL